MTATPAQADEFRALFAELAHELVTPLNRTYEQLAELLRDPSPTIDVGGVRYVLATLTVANTPVCLVQRDAARLEVKVAGATAGTGIIYVAGDPGPSASNGVPLGVVTTQLRGSGELWAANPGGSRDAYVIATYRT